MFTHPLTHPQKPDKSVKAARNKGHLRYAQHCVGAGSLAKTNGHGPAREPSRPPARRRTALQLLRTCIAARLYCIWSSG